MIKTVVYNVNGGSIENHLAILYFNGCSFPHRGDNIVVDGERYVVQRKEYIVVNENKYDVALQVKKYIPEKYGF